jgi:hypothetical protein
MRSAGMAEIVKCECGLCAAPMTFHASVKRVTSRLPQIASMRSNQNVVLSLKNKPGIFVNYSAPTMDETVKNGGRVVKVNICDEKEVLLSVDEATNHVDTFMHCGFTETQQ